MTNQLKQLSEAATEGPWFVLDTKHLSTRADRIFDDRMGKPANAKFVRELVNAYRAGELIPASEARACEAVAYEAAWAFMEAKCVDECSLEIRTRDDLEKALEEPTTALEQIKQEARDEERQTANQWRELALQFDHHRIAAMQTIKMLLSSKDDAAQHVEALRDASAFIAAPPKAGNDILAEARDEGKREFEVDLKKVATVLRNRQPDKLPDALHIVNTILATLSEPKGSNISDDFLNAK